MSVSVLVVSGSVARGSMTRERTGSLCNAPTARQSEITAGRAIGEGGEAEKLSGANWDEGDSGQGHE